MSEHWRGACGALAALLWLALAPVAARAVPAEDAPGAEASPAPPDAVAPGPDAAGENEADAAGEGALADALVRAGLGDDADALRALRALKGGRPIEAREIAEARLAADPRDFPAHCILGQVLATSEGNLARALRHFGQCRALFEARYGLPAESTPWVWHAAALEGFVRIATDMGRYDEALEAIGAIERLYDGERRHERSWVLAKTGHLREARALVQTALTESADPAERASAFQVLCFLAAEQREPEASYAACRAAVELAGADADPVYWTNAAEAAEGVLRVDEAERFLVEATRREFPGSLAAPWGDLAHLYLYEGRLAEAVGAVREARTASRRLRAYENAQTRAWHDLVAAGVLLAAGHPEDAARLADRAELQPDRLGRVSTDEREVAAAVALVDRLASRTAAAERMELASYAPLWPSLRARAEALWHRLEGWRAARRAAALYTDAQLLSSRLEPHAPGYVELGEWMELDLVQIVGPGALAVALDRARGRGLLDGERGYERAFEAEIASARGRHAEALAAAEAALARLPAWEAMLRARVAATGAAAALASGDDARALALLDLVFQLDPGAVRRAELALPARIEASSGPLAAETARLLRRSPRLREASRGFRVEIAEQGAGARACLASAGGVVLQCAEVEPVPDEAPSATARRLAAAFHRRAFAPRIDLSQADLRALDGSTTVAAEHARENMKIILRDVLAE
jgi:hypothetical protein